MRPGAPWGTRTVAQRRSSVHEAVHWVAASRPGISSPRRIAVGIQTPRGALVDTVIEHGFPVFAVNPKQLDRFRDRFTACGGQGRATATRRCWPMPCAPTAAPFDGSVPTTR